MLHGLAGFIFGKSPSSEVLEVPSVPAGRENCCNEAPSQPAPVKSDSLEIVDGDEDEWLMVDVRRDDHASSELGAAMSAPVDLDLAIPSSIEASSGESSPSADECGWNLTPPPCFTASFQREKRGADAVLPAGGEEVKTVVGSEKTASPQGCGDMEALNTVLETSNFENLLIEHPSMSVYGRIIETPRRRNVIAVTQGIDQMHKAVVAVPPPAAPAPTPAPQPKPKPEDGATVVRHRREATVAELLLGTELGVSGRRVELEKQQRAERAYKAKDMGANRTRRQNAVALVPPQGNASPRKRRMKNHPAGRCNDRKCQ